MTLFFRIAILGGLLAFAAPGFAATDIDMTLPLTDAWKIGHQQQTKTQRIMEIVPKEESVEKWTQMVTYLSTKDVTSKPQEIFGLMRRQFEKICTAMSVEEPKTFQVAGFDALIASIGCGKSSAQAEGEYTTFFIVTGKKGLYQVSRAWKGKPFGKDENPLTPAQKAEWKIFFESVGICTAGKDGKPDCVNIPKQ
ncbi:MAG: hypothetical protein J0L97_02610 [Alphaproteobacteria bacterium]|nr:hypothetical protein [Alphaproteobacteria bacterium]